MTIETEALLGRERELAVVERFLQAADARPAGLVLVGEPGIGKTVLFSRAVEEASRRGYCMLVARPTRAESALSFVGLADLLADVHDTFDELPPPQRRALEIALLLGEAADTPPDPRAIGTGLLGVLRALASSSPVVASVDDLQWLDAASAAALAFALRRVTGEPVALLAATRNGEDAPGAELLHDIECERVVLAPLSVGATHALLANRLRLSIPRSLLLRIHEACRGNPLFALEIGRALRERGLPEPGQPFEIPADAETLFAARLEQLPEETLDALALAAASALPTHSLLPRQPFEPALAAGVVRFEGERIVFTHPLLASAAYTRVDARARRELHRRIAAIGVDREERARHLALAAEGPDGEVAVALDEAVGQAARRGAVIAAVELAELAVKLTPRDDANSLRIRKRVAAERHLFAGDALQAREILERLVDELPPGPERARVLLLLAELHVGSVAVVLPLQEQAAVEAAGQDCVLAEALQNLATTLFWAGQPLPGLARAREALAAAERVGEARLVVSSLALVVWFEIWNGRVTPGLLERALALEKQAGYLRGYERPTMLEGLRVMALEDDLEGAHVRLAEVERVAQEHGDDNARSVLLFFIAEIAGRAGRLDDAARYAHEAYDVREQAGVGAGAQLYGVAHAEALRGRVEAAQSAAEQGLEVCESVGYELFAVRNLFVLGLLALSTGDGAEAARILGPLPERLTARGYGRVNVLQVEPDAIEALIAVGDTDRAAAQLEQLDETAHTLGIATAAVRAARCHALLAAARHDYENAFAFFDDALAAHERLPDPLERGRTLLGLGRTHRRAGRRRDARAALQDALAIFEELGAALWAEQTRGELQRLGGRAPSGHGLTGAEERVARLVAGGKTNREVAAALFVTERTVETHLTSIYRKLELHSRRELARLLGAQGS